MTVSDRSQDSILDSLADSFMERQRRGERPTIEEYVEQHPDLADEIREIFPALALMEQFGSAAASSTTAASSARHSMPIPAALGDFRILREIGRGGMGIVYEAVQETLGRHVALKVLPPMTPHIGNFLERFRREAQSAARLHHTNIVPVFAVGDDQGIAYYAMQFIQGQGLDAVLDELRRYRSLLSSSAGPSPSPPMTLTRPMMSAPAQSMLVSEFEVDAAESAAFTGNRSTTRPDAANSQAGSAGIGGQSRLSTASSGGHYFRRVAELGIQIADAIAYAHSQGITHRDIKPSNLMLDAAGTVWITDFGLAKSEGADNLTHPGDIIGTLRYMAPEQLNGESSALSDIHAIGLTLYELVCLKPAFDGEKKADLMDAIRHRDPSAPRVVEPNVPRDLETIILKAIAKEPQRRYSTAGELAADLRLFLADRPVRARRAGWVEHGWRWCRRNRWVASLLALVVILLCSVTAASVVAAIFFREQQQETRTARDEARERLWKSLLSEAEARSQTRRPGQRFEALRMIREALTLIDHRHWSDADQLRFRNAVIACLALPDVETVRSWETLIGSAHGWTFGYDVDVRLERYVRSDEEGAVSVRAVADDRELTGLPPRGRRVHVHLSANGRRLAVCDASGSNRKIEVWDLALPETPRLLHSYAGNIGAYVSFTPDGGRVAYYIMGECLRAVDLDRAVIRKFNTSQTDYWRPLAFSPDGRYLTRVVVVGRDWQVQLLDTSDFSTSADLQYRARLLTRARPDSVAWRADSQALAAGCDDHRIYLFDVATAHPFQVLEGHANSGIAVAFDSTGRRLITNDWSNQLRIWDTATGRQQHQLPARGRLVRIADDGRIVTQGEAQDGRLRILRVEYGDEVRAVADPVARAGGSLAYDIGAYSPIDHLFVASINNRVGDQFGGFILIDPVDAKPRIWSEDLDARPVAFLTDGSLLTHGRDAYRRWPRSRSGDEVSFGPPQDVGRSDNQTLPAIDAKGDVLLAWAGNSSFVVRRAGQPESILRSGFTDARHCAVSPDGQWLAVGNHDVAASGINVHVYQSATLQRVAGLAVEGQCRVAFSPDGRWLWTSGGNGRLWHVGSWQPGPMLGGVAIAFTVDGNLAAVSANYGSIRLVNLRTATEIAVLQYPDSQRMFPRCFTADGSRLFVYAEDSRIGLIWDLRRLRNELTTFHLDWDAPALPAADAEPTPPKRISILFGAARENVIAEQRFAAGKLNEAVTQWRKSLAIEPQQPEVLRQLADALSRPVDGVRDLAAALKYIDHAVELDPSWRTFARRGEVHARAGDFDRALADFDRAIQSAPQTSDRLILARVECLDRLKRRAEAMTELDRVLVRSPQHVFALNLRARWQAEAKEFGRAVEDWRRSLKAQPNQPLVSIDLARQLLFGDPPLRRPSEAKYWMDVITHYHPSVDQFPHRFLVTYFRGAALYQLGQYAAALKELTSPILFAYPRFGGTCRLYVASCCQRLGRGAEARTHYDAALAWRVSAKLSPLEIREFDLAKVEADNLIDTR